MVHQNESETGNIPTAAASASSTKKQPEQLKRKQVHQKAPIGSASTSAEGAGPEIVTISDDPQNEEPPKSKRAKAVNENQKKTPQSSKMKVVAQSRKQSKLQQTAPVGTLGDILESALKEAMGVDDDLQIEEPTISKTEPVVRQTPKEPPKSKAKKAVRQTEKSRSTSDMEDDAGSSNDDLEDEEDGMENEEEALEEFLAEGYLNDEKVRNRELSDTARNLSSKMRRLKIYLKHFFGKETTETHAGKTTTSK